MNLKEVLQKLLNFAFNRCIILFAENTKFPFKGRDLMPTDMFSKKQTLFPIIVKAIERYHDCTWSMYKDSHDHFEMVYIKRGETAFEVSGTQVPLSPNSILIIKPNQIHTFSVTSTAGCEFLVLRFRFDASEAQPASKIDVNDFLEFIQCDDAPYMHIKVSKKNDIVHIMNRIMRENAKKPSWSNQMCYLLIMELFILISRNVKQSRELAFKNRSVKLKELLNISKEYIEKNYSREITLSDIASYVFLSESYFAHSFKSAFDISPKHYLLAVRIDAAKDLLAHTDQKIIDIAKEVGFSSQQRFNDIFKKHEGITPLKFRKIEKQRKLNIEQ